MEENKMIKQTRHGWVDLSNLPRTQGGHISWKNACGCIVPFQYQDICGDIEIIKYIPPRHIDIAIQNYADNYRIAHTQISCGELGGVLHKITSNFRYNAGDIVNESLIILSSYMNGRYKAYKYQCLIDGYIGCITESSLCRGSGCLVCCNRVIMRGVNDIATTNPDMAELFWDKAHAYQHSEFSTCKDEFRCPRCGCKIDARIDNVARYGLSCRRCGDGFSYPEKFVFNVLKQAFKLHSDILYNGNFETQKKFDWSKNILHNNQKLSGDKIYDFYISINNGLLIETHGSQHFEDGLYHMRKRDRTLEEEQENDRIKYQIAIANGILPENYIVLDCRYSTVQYIKQSVMQSILPQILNFTEDQINWCECSEFAMSSRMIEACKLWNNGLRSTKGVSIEMQIDQSTALDYLRRGEELGIVQDPPKHNKKKNTTK
jgi:hypothetical protein